jgi:hypothetical protein
MPRGESNFPFSVLTNSLTTLEESLAFAIDFEEIDSCGWSNGLIVSSLRAILQARVGGGKQLLLAQIEFLGALLAE